MTNRRDHDLQPDNSALDRLLADACAPAHDDELTGLGTVLTAFAHTPPRRRHPVRHVLARILAVKALIAVIGVTAASGVALAAASGSLPAPLQTAAHDAVGAPAAHHKHKPTPSPNLTGLCHAYPDVAKSHGKALDNPAFTALITAAGGKDKVAAFCAKLLAAEPASDPSGKPEHSGKPTSHPTGRPSALPTQASGNKPSVPPGRPSAHPTGRPTQPH